MKNKYDYKKKSNICAVLGGIAEIILPGTPVGPVLMAFAVVNAAGDMYWHPENYSDIIENVCPMPEEYMTEEEKEAYNRHNDKIDKLNEEKEMQNKKEEKKGEEKC